MQQYFVKGRADQQVTITDKATAKHMFQVMRLKEDDQVVLVFDDGIKRLAKVVDSAGQSLEIIEELASNLELPVQVTIASGFPKEDKKLKLVIQKGTELGAHAIWGFPADWSVAKWDGKKLAKKEEQLAEVALNAAQQSKRNVLPEVKLFEKKGDFLGQLANFDKIFVAYEESAKVGEKSALASHLGQLEKGDRILFVFGPEGGISPAEIAELKGAGAILCGLGPRILRTETAPLYALSAVSYELELRGNRTS